MRDRLPVYIENRKLPVSEYEKTNEIDNSYGYVSILMLASVVITILSIITIIMLGK